MSLLYNLALCAVAVVVVLVTRTVLQVIGGPAVKGPKGHWLLGNVDFLAKGKIHENFVHAVAQFGPLFMIRILQQKMYVLSDPESITRLLKGGGSAKPPEAYFIFNQMTQPSSLSIISSLDEDPYYKAVRSASARVFSMKSLRAMFPGIVDTAVQACATSYAKAITNGTPARVEMDSVMLSITVDVLGHVMRGQGYGACSGKPCLELEVVEKQCQVVAGGLKNPFRKYFIWNKEARAEVRYNREYNAMLRRMVADMRASPPPEHTLGAALLSLKDPLTGGPFPELRLRAEMALFFMAGFETTAHAAALALFAIIAHPEVEARVCGELEELGLLATPARPTPRPLQWEDLAKLRVLSAAVQEAMRLLPSVATGTIRVLTQQEEICGHVLPKGSTVWVPTIAVHRSPSNWERPDEYDINRWLPAAGGKGEAITDDVESVHVGRASKGFLPFSEGPRNCVGQALARIEILVALAQLLGSYRVELAPEMGGRQGFLDKLNVKLALRPMEGLWCHLHPRVPS